MKIAVFIKQVPDNTRLKFSDGKPTLEGAAMMMNPFDEYALETALRLKEQAGGNATVTVFSLGAANAREIIKKAIAAGADDAFLLSDPVFENGDSTANAHIFATAIRQLLPDFNVLVFGRMALDDGAGQTGPKVAEILNLPSLTGCNDAQLMDGSLRLSRETEEGVEVYEMPLPGVIGMMKCVYELRSSNIKGVMRANKTEIPVKTAADLGLEANRAGLEGSATRLTRTWQRQPRGEGKVISGADPKAAAGELIAFLQEAKVL